ncbi:MAG: O-antigen translocase [Syntrophales bacterium]
MNSTTKNQSYGQILQSTALVGGSQVIKILIGIIRTKILAVLLGPAGIGLMGMYDAVTRTVGAITGMGIGSSGVRQIAEAEGTGDQRKIVRTIVTLRRAALVLGALGMLLTIILSEPLSLLTFGDATHSGQIAVLSVTIFLAAVSAGQVALVQGMRRIADLAILSVLEALLGTVVGIPMIFLWGKEGIVPLLITVGAMTILTSWWYARKIPVARIAIGWREILRELRALLALGLVIMAVGLMSTAAMYLIQILVVRQIGLDGVGLYLAAATLSGLYIDVILSAMGRDFYPRLTAVAVDNEACNRMVNEQTEVGLLVAAPGILATLTFAPLIIPLFYSASFIPAYYVLRWQILGIFLRVVAWPLSYILLAKGEGKIYFWTHLTANTVHVTLAWIGVVYFGLEGIGIAFFALHVFFTVMMMAVVNHLSGFRWSTTSLRFIVVGSVGVALTFLIPRFAAQNIALVLGSLLTLISAIYSLRTLYRIVGPDWIIEFREKLKSRLGWSKIK